MNESIVGAEDLTAGPLMAEGTRGGGMKGSKFEEIVVVRGQRLKMGIHEDGFLTFKGLRQEELVGSRGRSFLPRTAPYGLTVFSLGKSE